MAFDSLDEFKDASRQLIWSLRVCVERPEGSVEQLDPKLRPMQGEPGEFTERMRVAEPKAQPSITSLLGREALGDGAEGPPRLSAEEFKANLTLCLPSDP